MQKVGEGDTDSLGHTPWGSAEQSGGYQDSGGVCVWHLALSLISFLSNLKTAASVDLSVMNISYMWDCVMWLLHIVSFILQAVLRGYPHHNTHQYFLPFMPE